MKQPKKKVIASWFDDEVGLVIELENHKQYAIKFYRGEDGEMITEMGWEQVYMIPTPKKLRKGKV